MLEKYSEAVEHFERVFGEFSEFDLNPFGWGLLIISYFKSGEQDKAKLSLESLTITYPDLTLESLGSQLLFSDNADKKKYLDALKEIGLE